MDSKDCNGDYLSDILSLDFGRKDVGKHQWNLMLSSVFWKAKKKVVPKSKLHIMGTNSPFSTRNVTEVCNIFFFGTNSPFSTDNAAEVCFSQQWVVCRYVSYYTVDIFILLFQAIVVVYEVENSLF